MARIVKRITKPNITAVALCKRGANEMVTLYKSADDGLSYKAELFTKASADFDEQGILYAIAYPVEKEDAQGDLADGPTVREMAYSFAKNNMALNISHDGKPLQKSDAFVAESLLLHKTALDPRFVELAKDYKGQDVDLDGAWGLVIKLDSEDLRKGYRNGDWNGVSIEGTAQRIPVLTKEDDDPDKSVVEKAVDYITKVLTPIFKGNNEMPNTQTTVPATPPVSKSIEVQVSEALAKGMENLGTLVAEEVKKAVEALKTPEQQKAEKIASLEKELSELKKASNQTLDDSDDTAPRPVVKSFGSHKIG